MLQTFALIASVIAGIVAIIQGLEILQKHIRYQAGPGHLIDSKKAAKILGSTRQDSILGIMSQYIFINDKKYNVGYLEKLRVEIYIDGHTATTIKRHRDIIAYEFGDFLANQAKTLGLKIDCFAFPKEGNTILGMAVSEYLRKPFLIVRTVKAVRFGYPIEGLFRPGDVAILLDDLCMEGKFLCLCVSRLRKYGVTINHCMCIFERTDGNAKTELAKVGVKLQSMYKINDKILMELSSVYGNSISRSSTESISSNRR